MGIPVLIYGKSGAGKSRSLKNFEEDEIFFVNIENKLLPFKKKFKFTSKTDSVSTIIGKLKTMPTRTAVIDDAGYIMTHHFMRNHREKSGSKSFEMYDEIADLMYSLVKVVKEQTPDDVIVYIIMHEDTDDYGNTGLKTIGKLLDRKVCLEGMVTMTIRCLSDSGKHYFKVKTNGDDITKTPEDMFEDEEIENDLKLVDTTIREYYGLKGYDKKEIEKKLKELKKVGN